MEEEKDPSPEYIKGFNHGYTMRRHEPELLDKLISSEKDNGEYMRAMKAASKQFEIAKLREQIKDSKEKTIEKGKER
jgi:hypothetical protein